jgi:hypothetical protein
MDTRVLLVVTYNGHVTVMAVGQSQRLYSGATTFTWHLPSLQLLLK